MKRKHMMFIIAGLLMILLGLMTFLGGVIYRGLQQDLIKNEDGQAEIMNVEEVVEQKTENRGTAEPVPDEIKKIMNGKSMKANDRVSYEDLSYLTIPHYDFEYNVVTGYLVVDRTLVEEVLDIFAELYDIRYPIERMELIDKYNADDFTSIEYNNTSAFNYRQVTTGKGVLSNHAYGRAIDINPQMNPYVYANGKGAHENAREYWQRDVSLWKREIDRAAYIGNDTEIYRIFKKYGWTWGGDWSPEKDYQHFEKEY